MTVTYAAVMSGFQLPMTYANQSLSTDTLNTFAIVHAISHLLPEGMYAEYLSLRAISEDDAEEMYQTDIIDLLNSIAPDGCYFGGHPGDGADIGFWEYDHD